jgi:hypothetical protein
MSEEVNLNYKLTPNIVALMAHTNGDIQKAVDMVVAGMYVIAYNEPEDDSIMDIIDIMIPNIMADAIEAIVAYKKKEA